MNKLTFSNLRLANVARIPTFRDAKGKLCHDEDGTDWSPAQWLQALVGELGEYANQRKKFERGDISAKKFRNKAAKELADVVTYLDILAFRLDIDLGDAVLKKFNEVSDRVKSPIYLSQSGAACLDLRVEDPHWGKGGVRTGVKFGPEEEDCER